MSAPHDPPRPDLHAPTAYLPVVEVRATDRRRPVLVAAAAAVVILAGLGWALSGGDDEAEGAVPQPTIVAVSESPAPPSPEAVEPTPAATPSRTPTTRPSSARPATAAELIAQMQTTVGTLVHRHQLDRDDGEKLSLRLRAVAARLADGKQGKAMDALRGFVKHLSELRKNRKISAGGFDKLAAGATTLAPKISG